MWSPGADNDDRYNYPERSQSLAESKVIYAFIWAVCTWKPIAKKEDFHRVNARWNVEVSVQFCYREEETERAIEGLLDRTEQIPLGLHS